MQLLRELDTVDMVFHLGDVTELEALEAFRSGPPLYGVHGNNDSPGVRQIFPARFEITIQDHRIVLIHGDVGGKTAMAAARAETGADIVLFGHSHAPFIAREHGTLLFNPGSPTDRRWGPTKSFGLLSLSEEPEAVIVPVP